MKLINLAVHESSKSVSARVFDDKAQKTIERLELRLVEGEILFDHQQVPILVVQSFGGKTVTPPPGPPWLGYCNATDTEVETLRKAGYTLADWREIVLPTFLADHGLK